MSLVDASEELPVIPPGVSPSIERMLSRPRPRWRGRIHRVAVPCSILTALLVAFNVPSGADRAGALIYGAGATLMLVASSIVHFKKWPIPIWEKLFRFESTDVDFAEADDLTDAIESFLEAARFGAGAGVGFPRFSRNRSEPISTPSIFWLFFLCRPSLCRLFVCRLFVRPT